MTNDTMYNGSPEEFTAASLADLERLTRRIVRACTGAAPSAEQWFQTTAEAFEGVDAISGGIVRDSLASGTGRMVDRRDADPGAYVFAPVTPQLIAREGLPGVEPGDWILMVHRSKW